jgi:hypothetical protein
MDGLIVNCRLYASDKSKRIVRDYVEEGEVCNVVTQESDQVVL